MNGKIILDRIVSIFGRQVCFVCGRVYKRGCGFNRNECKTCQKKRLRNKKEVKK
ncbi:MAG: hypothetical protein QXG39_00035 [Candidatus Aenigmatarchaeota archaeon]